MEQEAITNVVVVAHSVSGVWLQLLSVQAAERISRVVFLDAIVLKNRESFVSNAVGPAQVRPCTLSSVNHTPLHQTVHLLVRLLNVINECHP